MSWLQPESGPGIDFDDLYESWLKLAKLDREIYALDSLIERTRAEWKRHAFEDVTLWYKGRQPTGEYLNKVIHYTGNSEQDRIYMANLIVRMETLKESYLQVKGLLDVMHEKIKCWQTFSANSRRTLVLE